MDSPLSNDAKSIIYGLVKTYPCLADCEPSVVAAAEVLARCYRGGGKVLVCGNGGSASDSEHIVGELMKSFRRHRDVEGSFAQEYISRFETLPLWLEGALPAISLVSQSSLMTAFSNDRCADGVFAQQVYGYGCPGDVLWCISTSGKSVNVLEAAKVAVARDMEVVTLTGATRSLLTDISTVSINVPAVDTYAVQELHLPTYHCLCAAVEACFF